MIENKSQIWFTARNIYDKEDDEFNWEKYLNWSKLNQLEELVSLDGLLNELVFEPDFGSDFNEIIIEENQVTSFFKTINYVKKKANHIDYYNLLAVIKEPNEQKQTQLERDFEFIGYDLIEKIGNISALTNCGGFDNTFKPTEQNEYGLISDYERAKTIQIDLLKNNPEENHADCHLFEIWRHQFIGRNGSFNEAFCLHLEYYLTDTFYKSKKNELKGFWCDGVLGKRISKKNVNNSRKIKTIAWIGKTGQDKYEMVIQLGKYALRRFSKGTSMMDCLPSSDSMDWIKIDLMKNRIEIQLK